MKIIKSFLLVAVALSATTLLHAQSLKPELVKETDVKLSPPATTDKKKLPAPELKPMNGVTPKEAPVVATTQAPSPLKTAENKNQPEDLKVVALTKEANDPKNNLTAEQLKTLNGTAEKPKQTASAAAALTPQNVKPVMITAPAPLVIKNEKQ